MGCGNILCPPLRPTPPLPGNQGRRARTTLHQPAGKEAAASGALGPQAPSSCELLSPGSPWGTLPAWAPAGCPAPHDRPLRAPKRDPQGGGWSGVHPSPLQPLSPCPTQRLIWLRVWSTPDQDVWGGSPMCGPPPSPHPDLLPPVADTRGWRWHGGQMSRGGGPRPSSRPTLLPHLLFQ